MYIKEAKAKDDTTWLQQLKDYIFDEFESYGIDTSDWHFETSIGPGHSCGGYGVERSTYLEIFSDTPIPDLNYDTEDDREVLEKFTQDCLEDFMNINDFSSVEGHTLEVNRISFYYPLPEEINDKGFRLVLSLEIIL